MGSVSLDDAWQSCSTADVEVWETPQDTARVTAETELSLTARAPPPKERHKERPEKAQQRLCAEIARLRQQIDERDRAQSVVLYVALAVVVVLLVVVLQSCWKLQHATDCLLWYSRK